MWCGLAVKVAVGILDRILPRLRQRAAETRNPVDDLVVEAVGEVVEMGKKGEITKLLCGE